MQSDFDKADVLVIIFSCNHSKFYNEKILLIFKLFGNSMLLFLRSITKLYNPIIKHIFVSKYIDI